MALFWSSSSSGKLGGRPPARHQADFGRDLYEVPPLNDPQGILQLQAGLEAKGFLLLDATLEGIHHPRIAVGPVDVAAFTEHRPAAQDLQHPQPSPAPHQPLTRGWTPVNDQPPARLVVPVAQPDQSELLTLAAEAAILDHAQEVSRANVSRLRQLLGDEAARLHVGPGAQPDAPFGQPQSRPESVGGRRLHVLVVEDRLAVRESWCVLLGLWGHAVTAAKDGPDAIAAASAFAPDVVLMDLGLPTIDGYETARRIRKVVAGECPRFLALTGRGREPDRERSRSEGFAAHLHKPVEPSELQQVLIRIASDEVVEPGAARPVT